MKKFILSIAITLMAVVSANAQIATQNAKLFDNTYVGVTVGATTPLDFNDMFPLNPVAGLKLGKEFTPVLGVELEGVAILNDNHFTDLATAVKATNVGLNGVINWSNLLGGYKGVPRTLEFKTNTGIGWLHYWNVSANALTAKTGLDVQLNLGATKAHSLVLTPAVYWNLNKFDQIRFDKRGAQIGLSLTYLYHFKTSNGTRHFKTYDVGALLEDNARLQELLAQKPKEVKVIEYVEKVVEVPVTNASAVATVNGTTVIYFALNSAVLNDNAKATLDKLAADGTFEVRGYASIDGSASYNKALSQRRADAVAAYLKSKGATVKSAEGLGVAFGDATGRVVEVTNAE